METTDTKHEAIFALNNYCIGSRQQLIEKLEQSVHFLKERTDREFENLHLLDGGVIIKIVNTEINEK